MHFSSVIALEQIIFLFKENTYVFKSEYNKIHESFFLTGIGHKRKGSNRHHLLQEKQGTGSMTDFTFLSNDRKKSPNL